MNGGQNIVLTPEQTPWLSKGPLARLLSVLDADGEETRIVGGAVRNSILGLRVDVDIIDLATTAVPDEVVRRAKSAGFNPVPTGIDHGTITVVVDGTPFEVTTLREDVETFGRHAKVRFGRDWKKDAERRDFTMNALFLNRDGNVIDLVGGLKDLKAKRVVFIGDPDTRIREDYLRVLRFFRFHAAYGEGSLDQAGLRACIRAKDELATLSRERIRAELLKLLMAKHAVPALAVMGEAGLLGAILGGVPLLASYSNLVKAETAIGVAKEPTRHLGALGVFIVEDADRLRDRLRLTNAEFRRIESMGDRWWRISPGAGEQQAKALLYRIGAESFRDRALIAFARSEAKDDDKDWHLLIGLPERWTPPKFPLAAKDFVALGIEKGPALGTALACAEQKWIAAGFPLEKAKLTEIAKNALVAR
jgi:poly(A) polymerase